MASAATATTEDTTEVVVLWPKSIAERIQFAFTFMAVNLIALNQYISEKIKTNDKFILVIPGDDLENFLNDPVSQYTQVRRVCVCCKDNNELKQHKHRFENRHPKLRFYLKCSLPAQLDRLAVDKAIQTLNVTAIKDMTSEVAQRVSAKLPRTTRRRSPVSTRLSATPRHGFPVRNIEQIDPKYICPPCEFILREPVQLFCGHRVCQSCINFENSCKICSEVPTEADCWLDKGFQKELQQLVVSCPNCNWTDSLKYYQEHIDKHCSNAEHDTNIIDVYTTETRQQILSDTRFSRSNEVCQRLFDQEDRVLTTVDGAFIWKISDIQEKLADARSERQKSIYSPPFYSSSTGYKMCLRLYLNGDGDTRDTHLSLFFVILRGNYDAILKWPFSYKVKLYLIDHSTLNVSPRHITDSFWPDLSSNCFQRPRCSMNNAYGFKTFYSLEQLEKYEHLYVQDDLMFIKAEIEFSSERPVLLVDSGSAGLPNDDEHVGTISENFMHID